MFRPPNAGRHFLLKRAEGVLGKVVAARLGAFTVGGFAITLLHRHDIRVGIASGMFLKHCVPDRAKRLELLACLYPCYWRWSTVAVLRHVVAHMGEFLEAGPDRRGTILMAAYEVMKAEMSEHQVVGFRDRRAVELRTRAEARRVVGCDKGVFAYHPYMNPASRRTGFQEFAALLADLRSGLLASACADLDEKWHAASGATYRDSAQALETHKIGLWSGRGPTYGRTRLMGGA